MSVRLKVANELLYCILEPDKVYATPCDNVASGSISKSISSDFNAVLKSTDILPPLALVILYPST